MRAQRERETRTRRVHYRKQGSVDAGKRTRRSKSGRPTREEIERRGREGRKKYAATEAGEGRKWQVRWGRSPEKTRKRRRLVGGDRRRRHGVRRRKARTAQSSNGRLTGELRWAQHKSEYMLEIKRNTQRIQSASEAGTDPESEMNGEDKSCSERTFGEEFSMKAG